MKSINKTETLWTKIGMEELEKREEYTTLSAGCCWNTCCWDVCCWDVCCWDVECYYVEGGGECGIIQ